MTSQARYRTLLTIQTRVHQAAPHHDLRLAVNDLDHIAPLFLDAARRMQDARPGLLGAQAYDAPSGRGGTPQSAEERAVIPRCCDAPDECDCKTSTVRPDRTERDRRLLDSTLTHLAELTNPNAVVLNSTEWSGNITAATLTLRRLVDAWSPRPASDRDRRQVSDANVKATECALTREQLGAFAPVHRTSNLWGLLPEPQPVSRWLWDYARTRRRLPSPLEWKRHGSTNDDLRRQAIGQVVDVHRSAV